MIDFLAWKAIGDAILDSGMALDEGDYERYLSWFAPDSTYRLTTYVPELAQDNNWLDLDYSNLERLLQSAPRHVWPTGQRLHTLGPPLMRASGATILATSSVLVHRTQTDGSTVLFAAGRYQDQWVRINDNWRLQERICRLDTRNLTPPSAIPL